MDKDRETEWAAAQNTVLTCGDLVAAARQKLKFLAAIDRHRSLYEDGPVLRSAIYRYKSCWLPLLAKFNESSSIIDGPLIVPLDCEWIWHCHRLNPVQYKRNCEYVYGKILDSQNVQSTTAVNLTHSMLELWNNLYPEEPFELNYNIESFDKTFVASKTFKYDLVAAVIRQSTFYYQVARPTMLDRRYLEAAVARYKGFLHLIKRNKERSVDTFTVPTYDVDIMWHSHQLQSVAYCNDTTKMLGWVLGHDDTDSERGEGSKLDVGFSDTVKQWGELYGLRYWRAGAMYRGSAPSPLPVIPLFKAADTTEISPVKPHGYLKVSNTKVMEVMLEVVSIRNAPAHQKGSLFVSFRKKQSDMFLDGRYKLDIQSETGELDIADFECEPTGDLILSLLSKPTFNLPVWWAAKKIGETSISLQDLTKPDSELAIDKWIELSPKSGHAGSKPISLHVAISFTVPVPAPCKIYMVRSLSFPMNTCLFPFPEKVQHTSNWARFTDANDIELVSIHMRHLKKKETSNKLVSKQVVGLTKDAEKTRVLAELVGNVWSLIDSNFLLSLENEVSQDGHIFEFKSASPMKLFPGKKLMYEPSCDCKVHKDDNDFITVVEFPRDDPYGKAIALINMKSGFVKVEEDWFVLPGILLAYILSDMLKREGYSVSVPNLKNANASASSDQEAKSKVDNELPSH